MIKGKKKELKMPSGRINKHNVLPQFTATHILSTNIKQMKNHFLKPAIQTKS